MIKKILGIINKNKKSNNNIPRNSIAIIKYNGIKNPWLKEY